MTYRMEFAVHAKFDPATIVLVQPVLLGTGEQSNFTTPNLAKARKMGHEWADRLGCGVVDTCEPSA